MPDKETPAPPAHKVYLATWHGGSGIFLAHGEEFKLGIQRRITAELASKMKGYNGLDIVHTEEGSDEDVRVPEYVVPVQPDDEPSLPDWPSSEEHDSTPIDPTPKEEK